MEGLSFNELKTRCKTLDLTPCSGAGITANVLREKLRRYYEERQPSPRTKERAPSPRREEKKRAPSPRREEKKRKRVPKKKELSSEDLIRKRDKRFYETVRDVVPQMPDVRTFETEAIRRVLPAWNDERRWRALLEDLETLDGAAERGDTVDVDLVELVNLEAQEVPTGQRAKGNRFAKLRELRRKIKNEDSRQFITRYPALSWILAVTNESFRPYAIRGGYSAWIADVDLDDREKVRVIANTADERLIEEMLSTLDIEKNQAALATIYNPAMENKRWYKVEALLNAGVVMNDFSFGHLVRSGNLALIKKAMSIAPRDYSIRTMTVIESRNPEVVKYFAERGLSFDNISYEWRTAIRDGDLSLVKALVEVGAPISNRGAPNTLIFAAEYGKRDMVEYFLGLGLDPFEEQGYVDKESAFIESARNPSLLSHMIERYRDRVPRHQWVDALQRAIWAGKPESVAILLEEREFTQQQLDEAIRRSYVYGTHTRIAPMLEERGAIAPPERERLRVDPM